MRFITILTILMTASSCRCGKCDAQIRRGYIQYGNSGVFDPNKKVDGHDDGNGKVLYNSERTAELPTGANKLVLWVVLSPEWRSRPQEYAIAQAFSNDPRLKQIKAGTSFNYYDVNNPLFRESGLIEKVGTATPIVCLTAPDGAIMADGTAGMFVNARSCPKSGSELADMLVTAIQNFNPPPKVAGQSFGTPLVRELSAEQCTPDSCPPNTFTPNSEGTLQPILPYSANKQYGLLAAVWAATGVVSGLGLYAASKRRA